MIMECHSKSDDICYKSSCRRISSPVCHTLGTQPYFPEQYSLAFHYEYLNH